MCFFGLKNASMNDDKKIKTKITETEFEIKSDVCITCFSFVALYHLSTTSQENFKKKAHKRNL